MRWHRPLALCVLVATTSFPAPAFAAEEVVPPPGARRVQPASGEAEAAIRQFRVPAGWKVELFAAEPRVANISSFDIDPSGKVYVVEVFRRRGGGVLDMRNLSRDWLEDDLSSRTVADRIALVKRRLAPPDVRAMEIESDRVRLVEDRDGDGRADHDSVFATGFNKLEDGTAAGVLSLRGDVYFANIPNLWLLRDTNGDGKADFRKALHTGFGVHYEISGHDLHGLRLGPDGRIYFSVGDRGLNVVTPDGRRISNPDSGAVLRCEPDGSNLELVHTGLRNPQDLAFDEYGNLFTGDNNSDGGDATRWVYVVEGGDSGWRVGYQWQEFPVSRGPWNHEKLWAVKPPVPAAYIVPPIANPEIPGPAGLTYTGGVGLPPEWQNQFLLVDFRGGAGNSGVWALENRAKGASFELVGTKKFVDHALATDVEVGYDGGVYFSDWINGWVPLGKGRIYRAIHPEAAKDPRVAEVRQLLAQGLQAQDVNTLTILLGHPDARVRIVSQLELVRRQAFESLVNTATKDDRQLARLHAIWGLRRSHFASAGALNVFGPLLKDRDPEVRAQAAKVVGDQRVAAAAPQLLALFHDPSDRVKFFAATAVSKLGVECTAEALDLLRRNSDRDAYVRHGAVLALSGRDDVHKMLQSATDPSPAVRRGIALALRRLARPEIKAFLKDEDPTIVLEAARAINDVPIDAAADALAALASASTGIGDAKVRDFILTRALNANLRLGTTASAAVLSHFATRPDAPDFLRAEALRMLADWANPARRDRITGVFHPRGAGDAAAAADAVRPLLPQILRTAPDAVRTAAAKLVSIVGLRDETVLLELVNEKRFSGEARAAALAALAGASPKPSVLARAVDSALSDRDPVLRKQAILVTATLPDGAAQVRKVLDSDNARDSQAAFEAIKSLDPAAGEELLAQSLDRLLAGKVAPEARLDLLTAAAAHRSQRVARKLKQYESLRPGDDALSGFRETLAGGDAERGRKIFTDRADVQCLRCHAIKGDGGSAGPDLAGIGKRQSREYLLESVLFPEKHIAKGWETVTVRLNNGDTVAGVLKNEDEKQLVLADPEKGDLTIDKAKVTARRGGQTAMPQDVAQALSKHDLRDLVEFLAGLK